MTPNAETARARRYLLGQATEEESALLEQDYFEHEAALDRMTAAEDDLIEEYLGGQLSAAERGDFERTYLASAHHRIRVETVRRLMAHGSRSAEGPQKVVAIASRRWTRHTRWLALAASLLVVASLTLWMSSPFDRSENVADSGASQAPSPATPDGSAPATTTRIFALTLSPVAVRSGSENPESAIPAGTDVLAIRLERDSDRRNLTARRASIRTVDGREVWQGPVAAETNPPPGMVARLDVPAAAVPADDYLITLYGTDGAGAEQEWAQYFLRVRSR